MTTQEELLAKLREHVGFYADGCESTDPTHCRPASKRYDSLRLEAADAIATLKSENAALLKRVADAEELSKSRTISKLYGAELEKNIALQSQAAAMAGLLEEARKIVFRAGPADLFYRIDAALAAWKAQ